MLAVAEDPARSDDPVDRVEPGDADIRRLLELGEYATAFESVVARYGEKVFRLAYGFLMAQAAAEDAAQDALLKVWKALPGFVGGGSLSSWIYTITRNTCLTALKRRRSTVSLSEPDTASALEALPELRHEGAQAAAGLDVDVLLRGLPEKYRRVITLFYLEQRSYEEVSERLSLPIGTVKTFLHRARKELLRLASELESETEDV